MHIELKKIDKDTLKVGDVVGIFIRFFKGKR